MSEERFKWIKEKIEPIIQVSQIFEEDESKIVQAHTWSLLKLLALGNWVFVYTSIIPKHFQYYFYTDLLAGAGVIKVKETGDIVIGSPLIAYLFSRNDFSGMFLVELNRERYKALRRRIQAVKNAMGSFPQTSCLHGDCNELIDIITKKIRSFGKGIHTLAFIDNAGLNTHWKTIEELISIRSDMIILFPTRCTERVWSPKALNLFFGNDSWRGAKSSEELLMIYKENLRKTYRKIRKGDPYVSDIRVGSRNFYYDLILLCKYGPYTKAWEYIRSKINWQDPETIKIILDIRKRRVLPFDFLIDLEGEIKRIEQKQATKLEDFL